MSLKALEDERQISQGLSMFSRLIDGKRWDELDKVFAQDMTFNYGAFGDQVGLDALRALFRKCLDTCGPTQHFLGSIIIDVDGDTAVSRAYVQARHQRRDDFQGEILDANGEYIDRWQRRPEGWRIVHRDSTWSIFIGDLAITNLEGELG